MLRDSLRERLQGGAGRAFRLAAARQPRLGLDMADEVAAVTWDPVAQDPVSAPAAAGSGTAVRDPVSVAAAALVPVLGVAGAPAPESAGPAAVPDRGVARGWGSAVSGRVSVPAGSGSDSVGPGGSC
ncbi:hypothetical protein OH799_04615 [Nocardia sp. NBC_00881]|uniref:hypothetical protein n=1 Tax=Nocardia sp. NBC_00881 TaxID=2975995 RepID=UPI0038643B31|nr:hypothetical protein OH799_04615 [Nocardia sp. NBC_00881]